MSKKVSHYDKVCTYQFNIYKRNARYRNLEFSIPKETFVSCIFSSCHYCGMCGSMATSRVGGNVMFKETPILHNGIDRIDSTLPYTLDNIVTACKSCNTMKNTRRTKDFLIWAENIYQNLKLDTLQTIVVL